jgi:hypothetical protein
MILGGLHPDPGVFYYQVLSVEFLNGERFQDHQYVQEAYNLTDKTLTSLNIPKYSELLQICTGNNVPHILF